MQTGEKDLKLSKFLITKGVVNLKNKPCFLKRANLILNIESTTFK